MNNFVLRTLTSIVFVAIMIGGLLFNPICFGALFLIIMLVSMQEFFKMSVGQRMPFEQTLTLLTAAAFFCLVYAHCCYGLESIYMAFSAAPLVFVLLSSLAVNSQREDFGLLAYLFFALFYIAVPFSLANCLVFHSCCGFSGYFLLSVFIVIWACDVGAYCIGSLLGQREGARKLAPTISPKKSWWGFWGGMFLGVCASVALYFIGWINISLIQSIILGILISGSGIVGDLFESKWKRYFGYKDSGNCIPGHGGMLDRFDSTIAVIPVVTVYMIILGAL